jgi:hypothetical protein
MYLRAARTQLSAGVNVGDHAIPPGMSESWSATPGMIILFTIMSGKIRVTRRRADQTSTFYIGAKGFLILDGRRNTGGADEMVAMKLANCTDDEAVIRLLTVDTEMSLAPTP